MSGIDDPGTPPELPEEYADTYRDAYRRALEDTGGSLLGEVAEPEQVVVAETGGGLNARWIVVAVVAVLVLVAGAYGIGQLLGSSVDDRPDGASSPSVQQTEDSSPSDPEASDEPSQEPVEEAWDGDVAPVAAESAEASCTSDPGVDSANDPVTYDAANTLDDDATTAWRCDGPARRETLTFTLPTGTELGEVGLIPGYAKTDAKSGIDRYAENNRITKVRWTFDDGTEVTQVLDPSPSDREVQLLRVPRTETSSVTLTILKVERGPRNTTAISSVAFSAADD